MTKENKCGMTTTTTTVARPRSIKLAYIAHLQTLYEMKQNSYMRVLTLYIYQSIIIESD